MHIVRSPPLVFGAQIGERLAGRSVGWVDDESACDATQRNSRQLALSKGRLGREGGPHRFSDRATSLFCKGLSHYR